MIPNCSVLFRSVACAAALAGPLLAQLDIPSELREIRPTLPMRALDVEGNTRTDSPWRRNGGAMRAMYVYGSDMLDHDRPVRIAGLAFRPDTTQGSTTLRSTWDVTVDLSTGARTPGNLSPRFDDNHGADRTRVSAGTILVDPLTLPAASPREASRMVSFSPFTWDPTLGPLVLDLRVTASTGPGFLADAVSDGNESYERLLHTSDPNAATADFGPQRRALVVQLLLASDVAPSDLTHTDANSGTVVPWMFPANAGVRVQYAYDASTLAITAPTRITRLAWRLNHGTVPFDPRTYDLRVRLSHGRFPAESLARSFESNHGPDVSVVFDGSWGARGIPVHPSRIDPAGFDLVLPLQKTFTYDPAAGPLLLDIQVRNATGVPTSAGFDAISQAGAGVGRVWHSNDWRASVANRGPEPFGLVTAFHGSPQVVFGAGSVPGPVGVPWQLPCRVQMLYPRSLLSPAQQSRPIQITNLSWRGQGSLANPWLGTTELRATVRLSTTTASQLAPQFGANHGVDLTEVCSDATFSVPRADAFATSLADAHVVSLHLDRPFTWDPRVGALLVELVSAGTVSGVGIDTRYSRLTGAETITSTDPRSAVAQSRSVDAVPDLMLGGRFSSNPLIRSEGTSCAPFTTRATVTHVPELPTAEFAFGVETDPNRLVFCVLGLTPASIPLDPFGLPGCTFLTGGELATLGYFTDGAGRALQPLPLRADPTASGLRLFAQWLVVFPGNQMRLTERTEIMALR